MSTLVSEIIYDNWKPFTNDEKCFLFYFKSPGDFHIIVLTFWLCRKNGLIRKLWLFSKLMMSQTRQQIITIHILPNISGSKGNQAIWHLVSYQKV